MTFFLLKTQAGGIIWHPLGQISVRILLRSRYTNINELYPYEGRCSDLDCGPRWFGLQLWIQFASESCGAI